MDYTKKKRNRKMEETKKKYKYLVISLFCLFLGIHYWDKFVILLSVIISAISPLLLGCVMAYILNILMNFFEKNYCKIKNQNKIIKKSKRPICMIMSFISLFGIIGLIIGIVIPELINCGKCMIEDVPPILEDWWGKLIVNEKFQNYYHLVSENIPTFNEIKGTITKNANAIFSNMGGVVGSIFNAVGSVFSSVVNIIIGFIFSIYILSSKENLQKTSILMIKTYCSKSSDKILYFFRIANECFKNFIVGQCLDAIILGILCVIGMLIFDFPYAIMIGVLLGFTALIPIAGAYIGAGIGAFMMLTISPTKALLFIVFVIVLQQIEGNLIYPKIVGDSIGLPGMWVLVSITLGGGLFGIVGMLVSVPLVATFYKIIQNDLEKKNKSNKTNKENQEVKILPIKENSNGDITIPNTNNDSIVSIIIPKNNNRKNDRRKRNKRKNKKG